MSFPTPVSCVQAYVPPFLDLRYVANYTNDGAETSCHTFQRRFSRRYLPYREAAPVPQPGLLAVGHGAAEGVQAEVAAADGSGGAAGAGSAADAARGAAPSGEATCGAGAPSEPGADDEAEEVALGDGALADSERLLGRALGPVDPSIKMAARKAAHSLVQYVQKAHLLTLWGLAAEFVRDAHGHLWLLGPLRCDWASLIPGGWAVVGLRAGMQQCGTMRLACRDVHWSAGSAWHGLHLSLSIHICPVAAYMVVQGAAASLGPTPT